MNAPASPQMERPTLYGLQVRRRIALAAFAATLVATWLLAVQLAPRPVQLLAPKDHDLVVLNGCVVSACNYLANVRAAHRLQEHFWARVLLVRYNDQDAGHAYCVWETDGQLFGYDRGGSYPIPTGDRDPKLIASTLATELEKVMKKPMVVASAAFIEPAAAKLYAF